GSVTVDVLANDVVSPGRVPTLGPAVEANRGGTCTRADDRAITFTAPPGYRGTAGCVYQLLDGPGNELETLSAWGVLQIEVTSSTNRAPVVRHQVLHV